ncbi:MAG TPA: methyltransferase domain-containing protein [Acetobacteraceae bacterium]|jgi:hypothetical protein|nr:methyltransferase domain-containing protein [Acetobacteraceae bacterium]
MSIVSRLARYDDPNSLASRMRRKRSVRIRQLIEATYAEERECRILDIGGEARYWRLFDDDFLRQHGVAITLLNHTDEYVGNAPDPSLFTIVLGDGCRLPFPDKAFAIAHSNSVIEHVGDWKRKIAFAAETRRVARRYYVQMPAFSFPIEPHYGMPFFHWLPEPARIWMLQHFALGHYPRLPDLLDAVRCHEDVRLISRQQFTFLFPDAAIEQERVMGLTKSLMAVRG